jgi:hypothetical protein
MVRPSASTSLRPVVSKREHAPDQPISPKKMGPSKVAVAQQFSCLGSMVVASDDSETEFGWQDWLSQMRRLYLHHTEAHRITAEELKERLGLTTIECYLWSYLFMVLRLVPGECPDGVGWSRGDRRIETPGAARPALPPPRWLGPAARPPPRSAPPRAGGPDTS